MAQSARLDANGMPTNDLHSGGKGRKPPAINSQVGANNAGVDAQAAANNAQYQQQQQDYQDRLKLNQAARQDYRNQIASYESVRGRYAAERGRLSPRRAGPSVIRAGVVLHPEDKMIGERVELISGSRVGTVIDTDLSAAGNVDALLVRLDGGKLVWIDSADVRYNRADGIVMTNLDRNDLRHMADQRLLTSTASSLGPQGALRALCCLMQVINKQYQCVRRSLARQQPFGLLSGRQRGGF